MIYVMVLIQVALKLHAQTAPATGTIKSGVIKEGGQIQVIAIIAGIKIIPAVYRAWIQPATLHTNMCA